MPASQNTLLTHYFGLYELKITTTLTAPAQKIYFTVMESTSLWSRKLLTVLFFFFLTRYFLGR